MTKKQISEAKHQRTLSILHKQKMHAAQKKAQHHQEVVMSNKVLAFFRRKEGTLGDILSRQVHSDTIIIPSSATIDAFVRAASKVWVMRSDTHPTGYSIHKIRSMYSKGILEGGNRVMYPRKLTTAKPYQVGDFVHSKTPVDLDLVFSYIPNNARAKKAFRSMINTGTEFVFYVGHQEKTTKESDLRDYIKTHLSLHAPPDDDLPQVIPSVAAQHIPLPPPTSREISYLMSGGEVNPGPMTEEEALDYLLGPHFDDIVEDHDQHDPGLIFLHQHLAPLDEPGEAAGPVPGPLPPPPPPPPFAAGGDESIGSVDLGDDEPIEDPSVAYLMSGGEINPGPSTSARASSNRNRPRREFSATAPNGKTRILHTGGYTPGPDSTERPSRIRTAASPDLSSTSRKKVAEKKSRRNLIAQIEADQLQEAGDKKQAETDAAVEKNEERLSEQRHDLYGELEIQDFPSPIFTIPSLAPNSYHLCSCTNSAPTTLGPETFLPHMQATAKYIKLDIVEEAPSDIDRRNPGLFKYKPHDKVSKYLRYSIDVRSFGFFHQGGTLVETTNVSVPLDFLYLLRRRRVHSAGTFFGVFLLVTSMAKEYAASYDTFPTEMSDNLFYRDLLTAAICYLMTAHHNMTLYELIEATAKESFDSGFFKTYVAHFPAPKGIYLMGYDTLNSSVFKSGISIAEQLAHGAGLLSVKTLNAAREMKNQIAQWRAFNIHVTFPSAPSLTARNNLLGVCKRLMGVAPTPTAEMEKVGQAVIDALLAKIPNFDLIPTTQELDAAASKYPQAQRPDFKAGAQLFIDVGTLGGEAGPQAKEIEDLLSAPIGTFTKAESYAQGENKAPRMIVAPLMKVRGLLWAMYTRAAHRVTETLAGFNVKGKTMPEIAEEIQKHFPESTDVVKTDHSSFESTITRFRRTLENAFVASGTYSHMAHFYKLLEPNFIISNKFYEFCLDSIRRSGEFFTSSGNCLQNYVFYTEVLAKAKNPADPVREAKRLVASNMDGLHCLFEGDDGLCQVPPDVKESDLNSAAVQAGARLKLEIVHDFEDVSFCKLQFSSLSLLGNEVTRRAFKDPMAIMGKLSVNMEPDKFTDADDEKKQFSAALSHLIEVPGHPMSGAFARGIIARHIDWLKDFDAASKGKEVPKIWERITSNVRSRMGLSFEDYSAKIVSRIGEAMLARPTPESYAAVERVYGYSISTMESLEDSLFNYAAGVGPSPDLSCFEKEGGMTIRTFPDARDLAKEVGSGASAIVEKTFQSLTPWAQAVKNTVTGTFAGVTAYVALCLANPMFLFWGVILLAALSCVCGLLSFSLGASIRRSLFFIMLPLLFLSFCCILPLLFIMFKLTLFLKTALSWVREKCSAVAAWTIVWPDAVPAGPLGAPRL